MSGAPRVATFLVLLLVGGTAGFVHADTLARTERAAVAAERARVDRANEAAAGRLNGYATALSTARRLEALSAAQAALATADAVLADADVLAAEQVSPLGDAVDQLRTLVAQAPDPDAVVGDALPTSLAPPAEAAGEAADAAPVVDPVADPAPATPDAAPTSPAAPGDGTPADAVPRQSPSARNEPVPTPSAPGEPARTPPAEAPLTPAEVLAALDLGTSDRVLEAAQQVIELSARVQAAADAARAELEAAERAAAEAAVEAERIAAEVAVEAARKVELADRSPNGEIPVQALCGVSFSRVTLLRCDAARDLDRLNDAYRAWSGRDLVVTSSYRDLRQQAEVKAALGELAATPGLSNHGRGIAVDFDGFGDVGRFDSEPYRWMSEHAGDFGWVHPPYMGPGGTGPLEPWHWEYRTE